MAFASLSTLQPIIGLYISLFSSLTYFFLGTGQQLSFGCIAILSIMMGSILDKYEAKLRQSLDSVSCESLLSTTPSSLLVNGSTLTPTDAVSGTSFLTGSASNTTMLTTAAPGSLDPLDLDAKKLQVAGAVTLLCGIILAILGKVGLGKVTVFMSDSLVTGFTVGAAFHVGSSQLKTMFGLGFLPRESGVFKLIRLWVSILVNIHRSNVASIIASAILILIIYLVKRFVNEKYKKKLRVPIPIDLLVLILATIVSFYADLYKRFDISIVKDVPVGVPAPRIPDLSLGVDYLVDGLVIIIVAFAQNVSIAKLMGLKHNYKVDSNQEMFAVGMVNIVCSVFSGYIAGASVSRSAVQDSAGGRTQIASLIAAALVLMVMLFIGPYFYYVPKCALSAIIMVSLRSLILKLLTIPDQWRKSKVDCLIFVITVAAVVILDADIGLLVGIVVSIFLVLFQSMRSSVDVTAHIAVGELNVWRSKDKYFGGEDVTDVKVVRINSPLYFVNAEITANAVFKKTGLNPLKTKSDKSVDVGVKSGSGSNKSTDKTEAEEAINVDAINGTPSGSDALHNSSSTVDTEKGETQRQNTATVNEVEIDGRDSQDVPDPTNNTTCLSLPSSNALPFTALIMDLSGVSFMDLMGVKALEFLISNYKRIGVRVFVTNVTENCLDTLQKSGFIAKHGEVVLLSIETVLAQLSQNQNQEVTSTNL